MKTIITLVAGLLALSPFPATAAQTAQATLFCFSLRFQQGSSTAGDFTLDLTTADPPAAPNGELAPTRYNLSWYDATFGEPSVFVAL